MSLGRMVVYFANIGSISVRAQCGYVAYLAGVWVCALTSSESGQQRCKAVFLARALSAGTWPRWRARVYPLASKLS